MILKLFADSFAGNFGHRISLRNIIMLRNDPVRDRRSVGKKNLVNTAPGGTGFLTSDSCYNRMIDP